MDCTLSDMRAEDWDAVRSIYLEGMATGDATLETDAPQWTVWDGQHLRDCRLVARMDNRVVGWAALSPVSGRCVYGGVAEVSVYVAEKARRKGAGAALLRALIDRSERAGLWTLQAGVLKQSEASLALHEACGFGVVGTRERIGRLNGVWRDVILLERRSRVVGV